MVSHQVQRKGQGGGSRAVRARHKSIDVYQDIEIRYGLADNKMQRYGELLKIAGGKERMTRHFDETRWPVQESGRGDLIKRLHERKTAIFMELLDGGGMVLRPGVARLGRDRRRG